MFAGCPLRGRFLFKTHRNVVGILLAVAGGRSVEAFAVGRTSRLTVRSGVFTGRPMVNSSSYRRTSLVESYKMIFIAGRHMP